MVEPAPGDRLTAGERRRIRAWALRRTADVLRASAGERVRARHAARVPAGPDALDARWLTAILCRDTPGARVTAVTCERRGAGTTTRSRHAVTYNDAGVAAELPTRLFAKWTTGVGQRLMLGLGGFIDGEPGFYTQVRPRLEIEAPAGLFGAVDPRSWCSLVLCEDVVATRGARFHDDPTVDVTHEQVADLLREAATWHGALWEDPAITRLGWLKTPAQLMGVIDALVAFADRAPVGARRARDVIPAALHGRDDALRTALRRSMTQLSEGPSTFLHGDLHIANAYRTADGRMGVCDWQTCLRGGWAHDVAYLIATACRIEDRRAWERELLALYLEELARAGGPRIAPAHAWESYRRALFYPYFAWTYTLGRSALQPSFQPPETSRALVGRIATAIDDLDALAAVGV